MGSNGASCFDHFKPVAPTKSQEEKLSSAKCTGTGPLKFSDSGSSLPITIKSWAITSPAPGTTPNIDGGQLDVANSPNGKILTFSDHSTPQPTFSVLNTAPTASENGTYNSTIALATGAGTCFTKGNESIPSSSQPVKFTFNSTTGTICTAKFTFDNTTCPATFTNDKIDETTFSSGLCGAAFKSWSDAAKSSSAKSDITATINTPTDNQVTFAPKVTPPPAGNLAYPLATLEWQADSWLTQADSLTGLVPGGLKANTVTSEGAGFTMLITGGMMKVLKDQGKDSSDGEFVNYQKAFTKAYTAINGILENSNYHGLLPWELDIIKGKLTVDKDALQPDRKTGVNATDGDFFIAMGEQLAYQATGNIDYSTKAQDMMKAIIDPDHGDISTTNEYIFLNCGGRDTASPDPDLAAYTKSMLPIMYDFAQLDKKSGDSAGEAKWNTLIDNTLDIMSATQSFETSAKGINQQWSGILGFIEQNTDKKTTGAIHVNAKGGKLQSVDLKSSSGSKYGFQFNYDALRVPLEVGGFLMVADQTSSTYANDYKTAQTVIKKEMDAIDTNFFKDNKYQVYVSQTCDHNSSKECTTDYPTGSGNYYKVYADMTKSPGSDNVYFDEAMGGNFLIGNLGYAISTPGSKSDELKFMETKLINQGFGSSSYYDPFYKIFSGLIIDGALTPATKPLPAVTLEITPRTVMPSRRSHTLPNGLEVWPSSSPGGAGAIMFGPGFYNFSQFNQGDIDFSFTTTNGQWDAGNRTDKGYGTYTGVKTWNSKDNADVWNNFTCNMIDHMIQPDFLDNNKTITIHCKIKTPGLKSINSGDYGMIYMTTTPQDLTGITVTASQP